MVQLIRHPNCPSSLGPLRPNKASPINKYNSNESPYPNQVSPKLSQNPKSKPQSPMIQKSQIPSDQTYTWRIWLVCTTYVAGPKMGIVVETHDVP